jgi:hypothetical protein
MALSAKIFPLKLSPFKEKKMESGFISLVSVEIEGYFKKIL